jgi:hypothetical protein
MIRPRTSAWGRRGAGQARDRSLNRDGTFNVEREGLSFFKSLTLYHTLLANGAATVDAFAGLRFFALVAGLGFARFAEF